MKMRLTQTQQMAICFAAVRPWYDDMRRCADSLLLAGVPADRTKESLLRRGLLRRDDAPGWEGRICLTGAGAEEYTRLTGDAG